MLQTLIENLSACPPLELEAVSLLGELRSATGEWFPSHLIEADKQRVVAATVELVAYTERCASVARRLAHLPPVPLDQSLVEFGL